MYPPLSDFTMLSPDCFIEDVSNQICEVPPYNRWRLFNESHSLKANDCCMPLRANVWSYDYPRTPKLEHSTVVHGSPPTPISVTVASFIPKPNKTLIEIPNVQSNVSNCSVFESPQSFFCTQLKNDHLILPSICGFSEKLGLSSERSNPTRHKFEGNGNRPAAFCNPDLQHKQSFTPLTEPTWLVYPYVYEGASNLPSNLDGKKNGSITYVGRSSRKDLYDSWLQPQTFSDYIFTRLSDLMRIRKTEQGSDIDYYHINLELAFPQGWGHHPMPWTQSEIFESRKTIRIRKTQAGTCIRIQLSSSEDQPKLPVTGDDFIEVSCLRIVYQNMREEFYVTSVHVLEIVDFLVGSQYREIRQRWKERARIRSNLAPFWEKDMGDRGYVFLRERHLRLGTKKNILLYDYQNLISILRGIRLLPWSRLASALKRTLLYYRAVPRNDLYQYLF